MSNEIPIKSPQPKSTEPKEKRYPKKYGYHPLKYSPAKKSPGKIERDYRKMLTRFWDFAEPLFPQFRTLFAHLAYFLERSLDLSKKGRTQLLQNLKENLPDYFFTHFPLWIIKLLSSPRCSNKRLQTLALRGQIVWGLLNRLGLREIGLYELFYPDSEPPIPSAELEKLFKPWFVGAGYNPSDFNNMASWSPKEDMLELILSREMEIYGASFPASFFMALLYKYCQERYLIKTTAPKVSLKAREAYPYLKDYLEYRSDPKVSRAKALLDSCPDEMEDGRTHKRRIEMELVDDEIRTRLHEWSRQHPLPCK